MQRTILITGCSSGIGYDAAHGLAKAGWKVFATCRSEEDCARLRAEGLTSFQLDVADPSSIDAGFNEALAVQTDAQGDFWPGDAGICAP